jgi:hypothetical protein
MKYTLAEQFSDFSRIAGQRGTSFQNPTESFVTARLSTYDSTSSDPSKLQGEGKFTPKIDFYFF